MKTKMDLSRFLDAQADTYAEALKELKDGKKHSHWMWFIFPQIEGLGFTHTSQLYALKNTEEASAYLAHPVLGPRLIACCNALLDIKSRSADKILGYPDNLKLRSCMTLFSLVSPGNPVFEEVLNKYFSGEKDTRTLEILNKMGRRIK